MNSSSDWTKDLPVGQKVRHGLTEMTGVILDSACQYAHPKAPAVFSYLIRWEDGQVQALSEAAFQVDPGIELID